MMSFQEYRQFLRNDLVFILSSFFFHQAIPALSMWVSFFLHSVFIHFSWGLFNITELTLNSTHNTVIRDLLNFLHELLLLYAATDIISNFD